MLCGKAIAQRIKGTPGIWNAKIKDMNIPSNKNWKQLNEYKAQLQISKIQQDILIGGLLGDLSLRKIGKYSRVAMEQKNKEYLFHLYEVFKPFVRTPPKERIQKRLITSEKQSTWYFSTISHPAFEKLYQLFYPQGKKLVPDDLDKYLTEQGLAYWFMDDGSKYHNSYKLATCSFTAKEHEILKTLLKNKYDILCDVRIQNKKYLMLYISQKNESKIK